MEYNTRVVYHVKLREGNVILSFKLTSIFPFSREKKTDQKIKATNERVLKLEQLD